MKRIRVTLALLVGALLLVGASACGGSGGSVPGGDVAVVNGTPIARADLDALVERARKGYAASKQSFPKEGTQEFQSLQAVYLNYLVQKAEFEQQATDLHVTVTSKDVDKALASFLKSRYPGKKAQFVKDLAAQGLTLATFRDTLATSVLGTKIFDAVTKNVTVSPQEVAAYYAQNASQYTAVDFAKSKAKADQIYAQLKAGADFATLAKKYSDDPGSKASGGKLTDTKGQFVPQFEAVAFKLATGEISKPVQSQYGYHVIQALAPVKAGPPETREVRHILIAVKKTTPLSQVGSTIRANLLQKSRNDYMTQWVKDLTDRYKSKVKYATGFAPPVIPTTTNTTTATQ